MKVFLAGATGFIGSHTLKKLLGEGYEVRISKRKKSKLDNIKDFLDKVEVFEGDLSDISFAEKCVMGCDIVIHAAGYIDTSFKNEERVWKSNFIVTKNLFTTSKKQKVKKFVFLGSIFGLGKEEGKRLADENVKYNLQDLEIVPYVKAKRMEEILRDEFEKEMDITTIYPNFCLGEGDIYISSSKLIIGIQKFCCFEGGVNIQYVGDAAKSLCMGIKLKGRFISGGENLTYNEIYDIINKIKPINKKRISINPEFFGILKKLPKPILKSIDRFLNVMLIDVGMLLILSKKYWFYSDEKIRRFGYISLPAEETIKKSLI